MTNLITWIHELGPEKRPCAFVMSRKALSRIRTFPEKKDGALFGTPIHAYDDVPDTECVTFFDQKALAEYANLREKLGHSAAMKRLEAYVEAELIQIATIRSILERT